MSTPMATPDTAAAVSGLAGHMQICQQRIESALAARLPAADEQPQRLHEAMRYSTLGGGKRIRALLVYFAGQCTGAADEFLDAPACAVELIHAYSLVHDDLPAMDDDDLRRGRPTCHRAFDEATAVLVGDALQTLAFEILAGPELAALPADKRLRMVVELARASGSRGMVGGQAIDLGAVGTMLTLDELQTMHLYKTGALIRVAVRLGALCGARWDEAADAALDEYARCMGLAFQIQDDVLDVEGDTAVIGKPQGSDDARNKPTYPKLLGLDGAKQAASELHARSIAALAPFGDAAAPLHDLAGFIVGRDR